MAEEAKQGETAGRRADPKRQRKEAEGTRQSGAQMERQRVDRRHMRAAAVHESGSGLARAPPPPWERKPLGPSHIVLDPVLHQGVVGRDDDIGECDDVHPP